MTDARERQANETRRSAEAAAAAFPPLLLEADALARAVSAGLHGRRRAGPGETFWQHRPYAFGDPVSAIDWRQSARAANRLYLRQNEWEAAAAVWIWRDPSKSLNYASTPSVPTKRQSADVLATAVSILLSQAGERVGLVGGRPRPYQGRNTPAFVLEALLSATDESETPSEMDIGAGARVLFISDFFVDPAEISRAATRFAAHGARGVFLQVLDPAEELFPFAGRTEFEDMESPSRLTFGDAASLQARYRDALAAHRAEIEAIARQLGWSFIGHRTDTPSTHALLALYTALADARLS